MKNIPRKFIFLNLPGTLIKRVFILCIIFFYLIIFLFIPVVAQSQVPEPSATVPESDKAIKDIERKRLEIEERLREKERREREAEEKGREVEPALPEEGEARFLIKEIIIENTELLSKRERAGLLTPFLNREISYNDINTLVGRITNNLMEKGYITARVKIPLEQNLKSGKLKLTIVNGYIEDIVPDKDGIRRKIQLFFVFPFFKGDLLNVNDMDYGVEQMNRLESNNATMKIQPGEGLGGSKIVIHNDPRFFMNLEAGADNLGSESTGEYRKKLSAGLDNLLSINDNILLTYTDGLKNRDLDPEDKYSQCYTGFFGFPFGYWMLSAMYSRSEYRQFIEGLNTEYKFEGNDTSRIFSIERLVWRNRADRIKAKASLTLKDKETFIQEVRIDAQSTKLRVGEVGLYYSGFIFGGYFSLGASYNRGLKYFDANKDEPDMDEDVPRAQFNKYKADLFWNRQFRVLEQGFAYAVTASGQYGMETLYGSEKISIGDLYTVRGFKKASASGDRGYYIRNELSINDFSRLLAYLRGLRFFAGYDYGYVVEKTGKEANNGRGETTLAGVSGGINYSCAVFNFNVTYGRRVKYPDYIEEDKYVIYFVFTMNVTNLLGETWDMAFGKKGIKEVTP